jgi:2-isopropylmalate synthase
LINVQSASGSGRRDSVTATVINDGTEKTITGEGNGPVSAYVDAISSLGHQVRVLDYNEHALSSGGDALAAAYVECEVGSGEDSQVVWGVGMDANIVTASLKAVSSAVNRARS